MARVEPLRVLFVIPGEARGHSMIFARRQAQSLDRAGVEVESFHLRSRTSPAALLREYFRMTAHIARFHPSLVHAQFGTVTAILAALAAGRTPLAITYRGGDLNRPPSKRSFRAWLGQLLSQLAALRAGTIVCVSERLRQRLWWRRERAIVLPSGVDEERFRPEARDQARARLGWPPSDRVVLFNAGRDPQNKRLDLALQAAEIARRRWPGLRLQILDGEVDPERVPTLMNASDCLLVTSDTEGSPTVIQEALACAVPIVSVDVGDAVERLGGVANTWIVERDAESLGRALAEVTAAPLRTNGPEVAAEVSLGRISLRLCGLYQEALDAAQGER
jgi:teichuronic acid biosynthesis glycosyltransferase TuaC